MANEKRNANWTAFIDALLANTRENPDYVGMSFAEAMKASAEELLPKTKPAVA